jgi:hypothetical protein
MPIDGQPLNARFFRDGTDGRRARPDLLMQMHRCFDDP